MTDYADLEIGIHRRDRNSYGIELRYSLPHRDAEIRVVRGGPAVTIFDLREFQALRHDPVAYGRQLGKALWADPEVMNGMEQAKASAASANIPLRLRLFIGPSAPELHGLRWETLHLIDNELPLATDENVLFSRYLSSSEWRQVELRPQDDLRVLVVVANPGGTDEWGLAPVAVDDEVGRARTGLGEAMHLTELAAAGLATLDQVMAQLRDGYDILYLVAHGLLQESGPTLALEDDDGQLTWVAGADFVGRLQQLQTRPRLVLLASCQSVGDGASTDDGVLAALGPELARIGIPAVIAMQGNIQMETMARFVPTFFAELRRDGQIDRAMAAARGAIRGQPDWWAPTLFMRLKRGRLWYPAGFGSDKPALEQWPAVLGAIQDEECTPIIGTGLFEVLLGSRRNIAQQWADTHHFPMASHDRDDLPQVAQFLETFQKRAMVQRELNSYLKQTILERIAREEEAGRRNGGVGAAPEITPPTADSKLDELASILRRLRRHNQRFESHDALAQLPFRIFITTDPTNLLADALAEANKQPRVELCRWNEDLERRKSVFEDDPDYEPSVQEPLIFQLFGNVNERRSLVLTEDDYFEYLIGVTRNNELIPPVVRDALADSALLFLGFRLDDWDFRVLFRSLMKQRGRRTRNDNVHVAAQVDLEDGRIMEPDRAREFLERYFGANDVNIYWGNAAGFVRELQQRWDAQRR